MNEVISIYKAPVGWQKDERYVYIGRAGKGMDGYFGNPVAVGKTCIVCGKTHVGGGETLPCYEVWLKRRLVADKKFAEKVKALKGKVLVCFCKPKPCHGDVLLRYMD